MTGAKIQVVTAVPPATVFTRGAKKPREILPPRVITRPRTHRRARSIHVHAQMPERAVASEVRRSIRQHVLIADLLCNLGRDAGDLRHIIRKPCTAAGRTRQLLELL